MDQNQPTQPPVPNTPVGAGVTPPQPIVPQPQQTPNTVPTTSVDPSLAQSMPQAPASSAAVFGVTPDVASTGGNGGSRKMWFIAGAVIVVVVLGIVGAMVMMGNSQSTTDNQSVSTELQDSVNAISSDIKEVIIDDVSADFKDIDADLSGL